MKIIDGIVFIDILYLEAGKTLSNYAAIEVRFVFDVKNVRQAKKSPPKRVEEKYFCYY